jgi:hypothetical protein
MIIIMMTVVVVWRELMCFCARSWQRATFTRA